MEKSELSNLSKVKVCFYTFNVLLTFQVSRGNVTRKSKEFLLPGVEKHSNSLSSVIKGRYSLVSVTLCLFLIALVN